MYSPLEQFDVSRIFSIEFLGLDLSFYSILLPFIMIFFFFFSFFLILRKDMKLIPGYWQCLFESIYCFILDIVLQQIGKKGLYYFPLVFSLFNFILFCNMISLTPFGIALTSHVSMIFFFSFSIGLSIFILGLYKHGLNFLKIFVPEAPFFLLFLFIPVELFSYCMRSFSLAIRLSANIMAGHTLVFLISGFALSASLLNVFLFLIVLFLLFLIMFLEFGVAFLQAYVFVILLSIYLNDSLNLASH